MTRLESEKLALAFLDEYGAHTMSRTVKTDEEFAAVWTFLNLEKGGFVTRDLCGPNFVFDITDLGRERLIGDAA